MTVLAVCSAATWPSIADTRHVVLLYDERTTLPGMAMLDASLRRTIAAGSSASIEFYSESMDLSRFGAKTHPLILKEYLRAKYSGTEIDVAVAAMGPSLDFLLRYGETIFPETPIVFVGIDRRELGARVLPSHVTGVLLKREFAPTLAMALTFHPDTRNVVVVAGTSDFDAHILADARKEFRDYEGHLRFTYLTDMPFRQLLDELSRLPAHTIILYTTLFQDGAGGAFIPHDVAEQIALAANAPVYGFVDQYLGRGIVGGSLYSLNTHGERAAALILRVLAGAEPSTLPLVEPTSSVTMFDWRQLQRWGISESRLPPGSVVRFREPTAWDQYRWQIIVIALAFCGLAAMVALLLYERRLRRRAEEERRHQLLQMKRMNRRSVVNEFSAAIAHEIRQPLAAMVSSADAALIWLKRKTPDLNETSEALRSIVDDGHRASRVIDSIRNMYRGGTEDRAWHDVNKIVQGVIALLRSELRRYRISVHSVMGERLPQVFVDRIQVQQVILNLGLNAVEAMAEVSGRSNILVVRTGAEEAGGVIITIADTGIGIDPESLNQIFEPFFTTKSSGTGLGLGISRSIVGDHGGRLIAELGKPHGMVFKIVLPAAKDRPADRENPHPVASAVT